MFLFCYQPKNEKFSFYIFQSWSKKGHLLNNEKNI